MEICDEELTGVPKKTGTLMRRVEDSYRTTMASSHRLPLRVGADGTIQVEVTDNSE